MFKVVYKVFRRTVKSRRAHHDGREASHSSTTRGERTADALSDAAVLSARRNGFF